VNYRPVLFDCAQANVVGDVDDRAYGIKGYAKPDPTKKSRRNGVGMRCLRHIIDDFDDNSLTVGQTIESNDY
jgi:hypothetical protein